MGDADRGEVLAPLGERVDAGDGERDVVQRARRAGAASGEQHHAESAGRGVQRDVAAGLAAELGEAERTLVPRHAGVEVGDVQLEVGEPVDGQRVHRRRPYVRAGRRATTDLVRVPAVTDPQYTYRPANMTAVVMADGRSEATWTPSPEWGNPVGNVHGGYIAVLVDDVAGMALLSIIGSGAPTVSLQVDYLNVMPMGRTYTARGEVVRAGKATALVDVHVYDTDEVLVARGRCFFQLPSVWRDRKRAERRRQADVSELTGTRVMVTAAASGLGPGVVPVRAVRRPGRSDVPGDGSDRPTHR